MLLQINETAMMTLNGCWLITLERKLLRSSDLLRMRVGHDRFSEHQVEPKCSEMRPRLITFGRQQPRQSCWLDEWLISFAFWLTRSRAENADELLPATNLRTIGRRKVRCKRPSSRMTSHACSSHDPSSVISVVLFQLQFFSVKVKASLFSFYYI